MHRQFSALRVCWGMGEAGQGAAGKSGRRAGFGWKKTTMMDDEPRPRSLAKKIYLVLPPVAVLLLLYINDFFCLLF